MSEHHKECICWACVSKVMPPSKVEWCEARAKHIVDRHLRLSKMSDIPSEELPKLLEACIFCDLMIAAGVLPDRGI